MATDYQLEIDEIKGESQDDKHKDMIDIESFSWGCTQPGTFARASGGGAGKAEFSDLSFTALVSKASPKLMEACAAGKHIKKATLYVRKAGGSQEDYYFIRMQDVLVSAYQSSGASGGDSVPSENFSLNFAKVEFEYKLQDAGGKMQTAAKHSYDLKANKAA